MTLIALLRHADGDHVGQSLPGRTAAALNAEGLAAAHELAATLGGLPIAAIHSSPRERAVATVAPLASYLGLEVLTTPAIDELDFGAWTERSFESLREDARWRHFNEFRAGTAPPGGELMVEAQARIVRAMTGMRDEHPGELVLAVSHGDVIRAALAHWLGAPAERLLGVEIAPVSVSLVELGESWSRVLLIGAGAGLAAQTIMSSR